VELDASELTVRLPAGVRLDLGATAKALAADLAARLIGEQLDCGVLVNLGGDIAIAGPAPAGGWRIGVDDCVAGQEPAPSGLSRDPVVAVEAGGVATSCPAVRAWQRGGRQLHHIVVPGTGQPAEIYWAAVTVAAATCVDANIASTASIIKGRSAPAWLAELGLPARLARPDGRVLRTGGWPN
jgi:thiamine biosynthesis lipoprotein